MVGDRRYSLGWQPNPSRRGDCSPITSFEGDGSGCSVFVFFFLALRLSLWGRAIPACSHLRMFSSHLSVTRAHLGIARHLIGCMGSVSGAPSPGSFAGMHFGLVSPSGSHVVTLISGLELVPVCSGLITCSLKITFAYVPGFVSTVSSTRSSSESFSALTFPGACALAIKLGCVPDFVFTFARTRSSCGAEALFAALALPHTFALVE